jgi:hypothetical protein
MKGWSTYERYRTEAAAAAERSKPKPVQTEPQPGSMEWFELQKRKAEQSSGTVEEPRRSPAMPGMLRKSTAFVPRYYKFESTSLQR